MKSDAMQLLLKKEWKHIKELHTIVEQTIKEEDLIMNNLLHEDTQNLTAWQKIADKVAHFGWSRTFIIVFFVILGTWITINARWLTHSFDPYPFILMNLILSCLAAIQAPIIMMSQNRKEERDRTRGENDYLINLKAELEIRSLHQKLDILVEEQIKTLYKTQEEQYKILKQIEQKLW